MIRIAACQLPSPSLWAALRLGDAIAGLQEKNFGSENFQVCASYPGLLTFGIHCKMMWAFLYFPT